MDVDALAKTKGGKKGGRIKIREATRRSLKVTVSGVARVVT